MRRCISCAARTARSASSSWTRRQAEDGHDRVADELLDVAAVALELGAHRVEVAASSPRAATPGRAARRCSVEPLRSLKTIVTIFRDSWGAAGGAMVRPARAGRYASGDHRQAASGGDQDRVSSRTCARNYGLIGLDVVERCARGLRGDHSRRHREVGEGDQGCRHQGGRIARSS